MHLRYYVPGRDEATERDVDPMRLLVVEGRPYLEGWCLRAEGVRLFRLDRVLGLEVLDVPSAPPAEAEPVDVDQGLFRPSPDDVLVELELSAAGRWVAEYYPCESVTELEDGRLRVVLRTPDTGWVRRLALRLGEDGRVISPAPLLAEVREAAAAALANYVALSPDTRGSTGGNCVSTRAPCTLGPRRTSPALKRTDMVGDLFDSPWKILIIAVVIIVLFGSRKLPHAARSLGQSMRILKKEVQGLHEDEQEAPAQSGTAAPPFPQPQLTPAPAPPRLTSRRRSTRCSSRSATCSGLPTMDTPGPRAAAHAAQLGRVTAGQRSWRNSPVPSRAPASSASATCASQRQQNPEGRMPLFDHLRELRNRVVKIGARAHRRDDRRVRVLQPGLALHRAAAVRGRHPRPHRVPTSWASTSWS